MISEYGTDLSSSFDEYIDQLIDEEQKVDLEEGEQAQTSKSNAVTQDSVNRILELTNKLTIHESIVIYSLVVGFVLFCLKSKFCPRSWEPRQSQTANSPKVLFNNTVSDV